MWVVTRTDEKRLVNLDTCRYVSVRGGSIGTRQIVTMQSEGEEPIVLADCESEYQADILFQRLVLALQNEATFLDLTKGPEVEGYTEAR